MRRTDARSVLSRRRIILWGWFVAAALLLALSALWVDHGIDNFLADVSRASEIQQNLELVHSVHAVLRSAESDQRAYLLTGDESLDDAYFAAIPKLALLLERLAARMAHSTVQGERVRQLEVVLGQRLQTATHIVRLYRSHGFEAAREEVAKGTGASLMQEVEALLHAIESSERERLQELSRATAGNRPMLRIVGLGGIGLAALILLVVFRVVLAEVGARGRAERSARAAQQSMAASLEELTALTAETRQLSEYAGLLQSCRSMEEAMQITGQVFRRLLPQHGGSVYLLRASQDQMPRTGSWGEQAGHAPDAMPPVDCWALRRGQPHAVADLADGPACTHNADAAGSAASSLCVPVMAQGETLGLVTLSSGAALQPSRRALVEALVEQLSLALANLRLQDSLRMQSIRDPLTGLFNRRYLEESLPRELARCARRGQPVALLMLDIDHFKRFNDNHGHEAGDAVLMQFARVLETGCRAEDIPCRLGGEEFVLVLPETAREQAAQRAEELRGRVEAMRVTHLRVALEPVTVSIGLAMYPVHAQAGPDLLRAADAALYRAKREGRNRVLEA